MWTSRLLDLSMESTRQRSDWTPLHRLVSFPESNDHVSFHFFLLLKHNKSTQHVGLLKPTHHGVSHMKGPKKKPDGPSKKKGIHGDTQSASVVFAIHFWVW